MNKIKKLYLKFILLFLFFIVMYQLSLISYKLHNNNYHALNNNLNQTYLKYLEKENYELKKINNINNNLNYEIAKVINRDIYNYNNEITIDIPSKKVEKGNAVINEEGLIGIVTKVKKNSSIVKLLNSSNNISVIINETYGNLNKDTINLLDKYSNIKIGDYVYTSGLTSIPKGIFIGKVIEIKNDKDNLGKKAKISLINNNNMYVAVINSK